MPVCAFQIATHQQANLSWACAKSKTGRLLITTCKIAVSSFSSVRSIFPGGGGKVKVCEVDRERSLDSLGLHSLLRPIAVQVVHPPGIQRSDRFLETLRSQRKKKEWKE